MEKIIINADETPKVILSAVNKLVNFIKPTYGPANQKILLQRASYSFQTLDDGVTIANEVRFKNEAEDSVARFLVDTANKTNKRGGDGSTTSLILLQGIVNEVFKDLDKNLLIKKINIHKTTEELKKGLKEAVELILKNKRIIKSKKDLEKIALVSVNDEYLAALIADLYHKIGEDGFVAIEMTKELETRVEKVNGAIIEKGYATPWMINNNQKEAVVANPYILLVNDKIEKTEELIPIVNQIFSKGVKEMVVIADDFSSQVLGDLLVNRDKGFYILGIKAPMYGELKKETLNDLAVLIGGKVVGEGTGILLKDVTVNELGRADRIMAKHNETVIVGGKGNVVEDYIKYLKHLRDDSEPVVHEGFNKRINRLTGGFGIIKVGAKTENEMIALKYKVEDAVNAVKWAMKDGIVKGAGLAYDIKTSSEILNYALKQPYKTLAENNDLPIDPPKKDQVINALTGESGEMMELGIIDPVNTVISALESAVSTSLLLITTKGILVDKKKKSKESDMDEEEQNRETSIAME